MERVQPHGSNLAASTIKIQKLISFPRSLKEHFSLKPCKVILVIFSMHGFTGCIPPCCKFRLKLLCLSKVSKRSLMALKRHSLGDTYDGQACVCTVVGMVSIIYMVFSFTSLKDIFDSRF
jgi:hypothetical protein